MLPVEGTPPADAADAAEVSPLVALAFGSVIRWRSKAHQIVHRDGQVVTLLRLKDNRTIPVHMAVLQADPSFGRPEPIVSPAPSRLPQPPPAAVWETLPQEARVRALAWEHEVREIDTGYRLGFPHPSLPEEPRVEYVRERSDRQKCLAKARELAARPGWPEALTDRQIKTKLSDYRVRGVLALVDRRLTRRRDIFAEMPAEVVHMAARVIDEHTDLSTVRASKIREDVFQALRVQYGERVVERGDQRDRALPPDAIPLPTDKKFKQLYDALTRHRSMQGETALRQTSVRRQTRSSTPPDPPTACGQVVQIDTTQVDLEVLDARTGQATRPWLTTAIDAYSRCILAARFTRDGTKGVDAALLLHDVLSPLPMDPRWPPEAAWLFKSVPDWIVAEISAERLKGRALAAKPFPSMGAVKVDHGKIFFSDAFWRGLKLYDIDFFPAAPKRPEHKGIAERSFELMNDWLWQHTMGHTGRSASHRGTDVEGRASLFLHELSTYYWEWVLTVYHPRLHGGIHLPGAPQMSATPAELHDEGVHRNGMNFGVPDPEQLIGLLPCEYRQVQSYGINLDCLVYMNEEVVERWEREPSPHPGKPFSHPIFYDPRDLRRVWFWDARDGRFHEMKLVASVDFSDLPFSDAALAWTKRLMEEEGEDRRDSRLVVRRLYELLTRWGSELLRGAKNVATTPRSRREQKLMARLLHDAERAGGDLEQTRELLAMASELDTGHSELAAPVTVDDEPVTDHDVAASSSAAPDLAGPGLGTAFEAEELEDDPVLRRPSPPPSSENSPPAPATAAPAHGEAASDTPLATAGNRAPTGGRLGDRFADLLQ